MPNSRFKPKIRKSVPVDCQSEQKCADDQQYCGYVREDPPKPK